MLHPKDIIGPYKLIRKIGGGTFGEVWLAENQQAIEPPRALKFPLGADINIKAVVDEAKIWVLASDHQNVLQFIKAETYNGHLVIISAYAPDGSLWDWLNAHGGQAPSLDAACKMMDGILAGLEHLHQQKIIHRDLKPGNILLRGQTPMLADFGISRVIQTTYAQQSAIAGTPVYMAPEAFKGHRSVQTDTWAAGILLYQLLTGRLPFTGNDLPSVMHVVINDPYLPLPASVPSSLQAVIDRALQKDPTHRYQSAMEMREALRRASQPEPAPNPGQPSGKSSEPTTLDPPPTPKPTPTLKSLIDAINEENVGVVGDLLDQGVAINALDEYGSSPLVTAVNKCSYTIVRMLLAKGADLETKTSSGATALIAIMSREHCGNLERIAQALLDAGANVNAKDNRGRTVLIHAVTGSKNANVYKPINPKLVEALLVKGANINARDSEGRTALIEGNYQVTRILLDKGAEVNAKDNNGNTALIMAAWGNDPDAAFVLLDFGADANAKNNAGETALMYAAFWRKTALVKRLLDEGADINAKDNQGKTALMEVARMSNSSFSPDTAQVLLDKGADVNASDNKGKTILMYALHNLTLVKQLLKKGANLNAKDHQGRTALMNAIEMPEVVQALLDEGADVSVRDNKGWTVLMLAEEVPNNEKVIEMLKKAGAKW